MHTPVQALVLVCQKRDIDHLLDFLEDYAEDASIVKYLRLMRVADAFPETRFMHGIDVHKHVHLSLASKP